MKKAVFIRFAAILLFALVLSGGISTYMEGRQMLENSIENMQYTIRTVDDALDYTKDLQAQLKKIRTFSEDTSRRLTIIDRAGAVCGDTDITNVSELENHGERAEVQKAWEKGFGYEKRYSQTLRQNTLYVAETSRYGDYVIRMSIPYHGWMDFATALLPGFFVVLLLVFSLSLFMAGRFADSVSQPLKEIAAQMLSQKGDFTEWEPKSCPYPEINIISETMGTVSREIKEYTDRLELEKKVRQEFFSNASHELKTPITSIRGFAELLEGGFAVDEAMGRDFLRRIIKETNHMTGLINDILMISRLETREAQVTFSKIRISILLKEVLASMEPIAADYGIELRAECQPVLWYGSEIHLREILINLISNGIKYNRPDGWVRITLEKGIKELWIKVEDNGIGISDEDKGRVFERFYRAEKGRGKKQGGTGLGLSIVKHIAEFYGGSIELTASLEKGSCFVVCLPEKEEELLIEVENKL